jgi:hypothetical protein
MSAGPATQQPGDLRLQLGDDPAVAVAVGDRVGGNAGQQAGRCDRAMADQEHGALVAERGLLGRGQLISGGHASLCCRGRDAELFIVREDQQPTRRTGALLR